jgi:eukaryotic-like serine/threonine-protein kinase
MSEGEHTSRQAAEGASPGTLVADKYRVLRALGHGAMGTVYLCEHLTLDKPVAVKLLHPELAQNPEIVARFQREALAAGRLDHPHSVRVMDFGQDVSGYLYLAMEYVEGRDLFQVLQEEWPLSDQRIVNIMSQVLSALSAAHALGIVHRDLKPDNILLRTPAQGASHDHALVCDFGIAQLSPIRLSELGSTAHARLNSATAHGTVVGTPAYMSPEQARGDEQDGRSDIYAVGAVLFHLLTRTPPFVAETPLSVAVMHCSTPPPPPSNFAAVNPELEAVCLKALSKTPAARFQSAHEMQIALEAVVAPARRLQRLSSAAPPTLNGPRISIDTRASSLTPFERVIAMAPPGSRSTALLGAAFVTALLGLVSVPRLLSGRHEPTLAAAPQSTPAETITRAAAAAALPQPSAASLSVPTPASPALFDAPRPAPSDASARSKPTRNVASPSKRGQRSVSGAERARASAAVQDTIPAEPAVASEPLPVLAISAEQPESAPPAHTTLLTETVASTPKLNIPAPVVKSLPAAQRSYDDAQVSIGAATASAGVSKASVRGALNSAALSRCYREALQRRAAPTSTTEVRLDFATQDNGRITSASVQGALPKSLRECFEQVARVGRVREVDTGSTKASVSLTLQPD